MKKVLDSKKKLSLDKETLRRLQQGEMSKVVGGVSAIKNGCFPSINSPPCNGGVTDPV
jgi:hypothetical protein